MRFNGLILLTLMPAFAPAAEPSPVPAERLARIAIPDRLLSEMTIDRDGRTETFRYGGDLRIGDLDNDGTMDFVIAKALGGYKTCYIGAFTWEGRVLWEWGNKRRTVLDADQEGQTLHVEPPGRPGPLLVIDIDGDGRTEVIALVLPDCVTPESRTSRWRMKDAVFIVLDGATGRVKRPGRPRPLDTAHAYDQGKRHEPNYVHLRLQAADFRGLGRPGDVVIKIGNTVMACDERFNVLWTYHNRFAQYGEHASYIPCVGDVDNDGRDELAGGQYLLDDDGTVLWEKMMARHNDSVCIVDWDGNASNGNEIVMSGYGQVVDRRCRTLVKLGREIVPHGQEVRCGQFREDVPGFQMVVRYNGHTNRLLIADRSGTVLERFEVDHSHNETGLETVYWSGPGEPALLYSPAALYDGRGRKRVSLPDLPPASKRGRMAWYHCIVADLDGNGEEAIILHDPYAAEVFVYGRQLPEQMPPRGYRHTSRQYNPRFMD